MLSLILGVILATWGGVIIARQYESSDGWITLWVSGVLLVAVLFGAFLPTHRTTHLRMEVAAASENSEKK